MEGHPLFAALHALYHGHDAKLKKQADAWLEDWQASQDAWGVSDSVLHSPSATTEARLFCAQTLRTKVQRDLEELPPSALGSLRESLVSLLLAYGQGPAQVRTQLGLAIAALAAHLAAEEWGPGGCVQWLTGRLGAAEPKAVAITCLVEMLTVLPQEAGSYRPAVRPERRRAVVSEMAGQAPAALSVLSNCAAAAQGDPGLLAKVLDAFAAWLRSAQGSRGFALEADHPLVGVALQGLQSPAMFEPAVEAVSELLYASGSAGQPAPAMLPLVGRLVPAVMELRPRFDALAREAAAQREGKDGDGGPPGGTGDDDEATAKGLARLFAEVGEAYTGFIATGTPEGMAPVEALLGVAAHPDPDIAAIALTFWHRLARQLTSAFSAGRAPNGDAAIQAQQAGDLARRRGLFKGPFTRLAVLLRDRMAFPEDWDTLHEDERHDHVQLRFKLGDALQDAAGVLGGEEALRLVVEPLGGVSVAMGRGAPFGWRTAEACLTSLRCIHKFAPPPGDPLLLQVFANLPQMPRISLLLETSVRLVGAYVTWLAQPLPAGSPPGPAGAAPGAPPLGLLQQLLQLLMEALRDDNASGAAAMGIERLCGACAATLAPALDMLQGLYTNLQRAGDLAPSQAGATPKAGDYRVDEDDVQQIMEGMCLVLSALPPEQRRSRLSALLTPILTQLQTLLPPAQQPPQAGGSAAAGGDQARWEKGEAAKKPVLALVDRLTVLFRHVEDPQAVAAALQQAWPLLEAALGLYARDLHAVEKLTRAPRYALRAAGPAADGAVIPLAGALPGWFQASRHSSFLYLASELVKGFGDRPQFAQPLSELFQTLMADACNQLKSLAAISQDPELADDFFLLAGRAMVYCPQLVFSPTLLPVLADTALGAALVQHREASSSVMSFLCRLAEACLPPEAPAGDKDALKGLPPGAAAVAQGVLSPRLPLLTRILLGAVVGALPADRVVGSLSDTLYAMLKASGEAGVRCAGEAMESLPEGCASASEKGAFMIAVRGVSQPSLAGSGSRQLDGALEDLSELIRRNKRAREAALQALLPPELYRQLSAPLTG